MGNAPKSEVYPHSHPSSSGLKKVLKCIPIASRKHQDGNVAPMVKQSDCFRTDQPEKTEYEHLLSD
jgi:hypothetical protein